MIEKKNKQKKTKKKTANKRKECISRLWRRHTRYQMQCGKILISKVKIILCHDSHVQKIYTNL